MIAKINLGTWITFLQLPPQLPVIDFLFFLPQVRTLHFFLHPPLPPCPKFPLYYSDSPHVIHRPMALTGAQGIRAKHQALHQTQCIRISGTRVQQSVFWAVMMLLLCESHYFIYCSNHAHESLRLQAQAHFAQDKQCIWHSICSYFPYF